MGNEKSSASGKDKSQGVSIHKEMRNATNPAYLKLLDTEDLRDEFLVETLFSEDSIHAVYTLHDRMIIMGVRPMASSIELPALEEWTKAAFFLERRECGIINTGGAGTVEVDGKKFELAKKECLYIGKGSRQVIFSSSKANEPADFYINSCPAHQEYPATKASLSDANQVNLGQALNSNERTIYQYIHEAGIQSCQLVMGLTSFKGNSIWNTFPPHTHMRRMEVYCYFDVPENQLIMHFMGEPEETRHLVIRNKQAVISPEWSIHAGVGTQPYSFIWGMAGENKAFTDMDAVAIDHLK
ncbi:MAG TPA: 5-dehydro-4-deoxy-D-glucuronate isomerase [Chitinophagaceae bacterium]|nr:5-dehydro-4-deoxy-D-glucuronate isomerase [Chitinophagaceae bacterium]